MALLLKGFPVAKAITQQLLPRVEQLAAKGITPTLAILRVGEKEDDISYEKGALKRCSQVGIAVKQLHLPQDVEQQTLLDAIGQLNRDDTVHGVLILRPLPSHLNDAAVCGALSPQKDVDGITPYSMAGIFTGSSVGYPPCTPQGCIEILEHYQIPISGKRAVVLGRSLVVGKPASMLLLQKNATVTICHTRTQNLPAVCREADILLAAAGQPQMVTEEFLRPGQILLDVGIHPLPDGSICGDVCFAAVEPVVQAITPVPGGTGAVTTAVLAKHVVEAAEKFSEKKEK